MTLSKKGIWEDKWVPTMCQLCTGGPDPILVHVVNGVPVGLEGNNRISGYEKWSTNRGHVCPRPYSLLLKPYNPYRVKAPMKRTNPEKGPGVDPKWVEISWEEALDTTAKKLKEVREKDPIKLAATSELGSSKLWQGDWAAFWLAWGPSQNLIGGESQRCNQGEHMIANLIHGGFQCEPDTAYCNYVLDFAKNYGASGGAPENIRMADAQARGMKVVCFDPVLTPTAAKADEWIAIRPGTDRAFQMALVNVILHEIGVFDVEFLKTMTNSPYLMKSDGEFLRDQSTNKVMMWDTKAGKAKTFDDESMGDPSLEGTYVVDGVEARPVFRALKDHMKPYTAEWAAEITDVAAGTIRRIAREWVENARIGSTINIDGISFPYRPVSTKSGRGCTGTKESYQYELINHILAMLVGSIEVPGGHGGGRKSPEEPLNFGLVPGPDGMVIGSHFDWTWPAVSAEARETLIPFSRTYGHLSIFAWLNLLKPQKNFRSPPLPEAMIVMRSNFVLTLADPRVILEVLKKIPFIVNICYTFDETVEMSDILLPEPTELERYEPLLNWVKAPLNDKQRGWFHFQQVIKPLHNTKYHFEILTELAARVGFLTEFNETLNKVAGLKEPYKLSPEKKHSITEFIDSQCKSATDGEHDLKWFNENGAILYPVPVDWQYGVHLEMMAKKLRYPLPYLEEVRKIGKSLGENLAKVGVEWWETSQYEAFPAYRPWPIEKLPVEFEFYVLPARNMEFALGYNVDNPWLNEIASRTPYRDKIVMNAKAAAKRGIKNGDEIWVESETNKVKGVVELTQGIRPDTLVIPGQFGQWAMPIARDIERATMTMLLPFRIDLLDPVTGSYLGVARAKVYKVKVAKDEESRG